MVRLALAILVSLLSTIGVAAQPYPSRPVTMIVPFPAGGPTDALGRILGERMRQSLGVSIVIENVGGAGGSVGAGRLARATPDGHTIGIGQVTSHVFSGAVYTINFDIVRDFEPIALIASAPQWLLARSGFPASSLAELKAWLQANPDKASFATIGSGSPTHVWGVNFANSIGARINFVSYRGGGPVLQDLIAGHVDMGIVEASFSVAQVQGGAVKALAVLSSARWRKSPDTPNVDEAGARGLYLPFWHCLWAPKGTPAEIVARLNAAVIETLEDAAIKQKLTDMGQEIYPRAELTPAALAATQKAAIDTWWPIIKAARIKPE